jgi:hypothetical protein
VGLPRGPRRPLGDGPIFAKLPGVPIPPTRPATTALLISLLLLLGTPAAHAESFFLLAYPDQFGPQPAATYDGSGARIGGAELFIEQLPSGRVHLQTESGTPDGARTVATAELAPVVPGESLRLVGQESRSLDENGRPMGVLRIDHVAGTARCLDPAGTTLSEVRLPAEDRVVNVPLNLFFLPLVQGEVSSLDFQLFLCRPEAQLLDFEAWIERGDLERADPIEIRYAPDFGLASVIARSLTPRLSVWFDPTAPHAWQAHRLPLYSGGPEVLVVRDDVATTGLVD